MANRNAFEANHLLFQVTTVAAMSLIFKGKHACEYTIKLNKSGNGMNDLATYCRYTINSVGDNHEHTAFNNYSFLL